MKSQPEKPALKTSRKKEILIVEDHPIMRQGLIQLIGQAPGLKVRGEAENAKEALQAIAAFKPDLILADISLPGKNGLELLKDIHSLYPQLPVLVLSMHDEALYAERVLRAGGRGYITKQEKGNKLIHAIELVLKGRIYVSEKVASRIVEQFSNGTVKRNGSPIQRLTDREFEIFYLIGEGRRGRDIAEQLNISIKTVNAHRDHIKEKLDIGDSTSLIQFAVRWVETENAP